MTGKARVLDDCFLHDRDRLRHEEALTLLEERLSPVARVETIELAQAHGRVLAEDIHAPRNIPLTDNSAVDGYAFAHADYLGQNGNFILEGRVAAGHPLNGPLEQGCAVRIFTGAVMPEGADTVVMQEDCTTQSREDGTTAIHIPAGLKPGANCRRAGEDVTKGALLLQTGQRLRPQEIAAIASIGMAKVRVFTRLKIALVSTGDEIRRPGEEITPGQVYDSNHFLLRSLCDTLPCTLIDYGVLPDNAEVIRQTLEEAARNCDVVLTTGGASRGEEDHIQTLLDDLGKRHMWQLAIKPGRPVMFGQIGSCLFFGLPGNPVAAMVCFLLYARPAFSLLAGGSFSHPQRFQVTADFEVPRKKADRQEFYRGILATSSNGQVLARKFERDGSGLITGLREADGLIEIPEDTTSVQKGEQVTFIPFSSFGISSR